MPLRSRIPRIRRQIRAATGRGVYRAATFVRDLAQQLAPVDEGDWRDSIVCIPPGPALEVTVQGGGSEAPHGIYVEYGQPNNPNYPAQPTLTPAASAIDPGREVAAELRQLFRSEAL